ncbi:MAG: hypothetical protein JW750_08380 [Anaerolineaceae bacterium]|nr:hypothetical protein [Anaerolineaceae bacterium]
MSKERIFAPLPKEEVIKAVERKSPVRIPLVQARWWGEGLVEQYGDRLKQFDQYPEDAAFAWINPLIYEEMGLSWDLAQSATHDSAHALNNWDQLDEFIGKLPDPAKDTRFDALQKIAEQAKKENRYLIFAWWNLFFERPWSIRGMTNLLMDYYLHPEEIHRLHTALCDFYIRYIHHAQRLLEPDGFWCSDDLGTQTSLFMSPKTFREFIKPYYARVGGVLKQNHTHWWLHSCGNNTPILGDLVEVGLDVFHPVQKHTMDEVSVANEWGNQLTFLAGIDVQHTLQEKDPAGVRAEVRFLIDTFDQRSGGMCIAAGNGIVSGTPFENIDAFLDESLRYGEKHRQSFR